VGHKFWWAMVVACASPAQAGEAPLRQAAPDWVNKAPLDPAQITADSPEMLVLDTQQRIEKGQLWTYSDRAMRASSAETLGELATLSLSWMPDKGDLILHEATILRDGKEIDLLADGKGFTVIRREEALEQRSYTGELTATMPVEGLRMGDILRLRSSTTLRDTALGGHVQAAQGLPAAPLRIGFARARLQWDTKTPAHWRVQGKGLVAKPITRGGFSEIDLSLPAEKQPDMPEDAPLRFRAAPLLEASTFGTWQEVSRVMAPLYATDGLITPGSPLAAEVEKIKAAPTPLERAQRALQLVQEEVRYLAIGMNGGNYVPQKPADTWVKRYGDCKAKTLLLLALLRGAGVEAEPVLAHITQGDLVPTHLPSAAAFNHVLVRAVVDGQSLWLDGTDMRGRLADIRDTPPFVHVLPLRPAGSGLVDIVGRAPARAQVALAVDADESGSVDLPTVFTATAVLRGQTSAGVMLMAARMDAKQRAESVRQFFTKLLGPGQYTQPTITTDNEAGTSTLSATGITGTPWRWDDKRERRNLTELGSDIKFNPDRARPDWAAIPVNIGGPSGMRYDLTLRLPGGGKDMSVEGQGNTVTQVAGATITRTLSIADGSLHFTERMETPGGEIPAAAIPAERDKLEAVIAALPRLIAAADTPRSWSMPSTDPAKVPQLARINAIFAAAIAEREPTDTSPFLGRASLRRGIGDFDGALADLTAALGVETNAGTLLSRATVLRSMGRLKEALADAQKARSLDPGSQAATGMVASAMAETGDVAGASALLDQRIALGGKARDDYRMIKAAILGEFGDAQDALRLLDTLNEARPGNPRTLNERCWIKGTRNLALDTALKDCTSAIELSGDDDAPLDSRAMVWLRMGRYDQALQDVNAVLFSSPGRAPSLYLRAIIHARMDHKAQQAADLAMARRLDPGIDRAYARYGIGLK